jgi:uncharacterized protein YkwD
MQRASVTAAILVLVGGSGRAQEFTHQEIGVFSAVNQLRARPSAFVRTLEAFRSLYQGNLFIPPGHVPIQTHEGVKAVDETIGALRPLSNPLERLTLSRGLSNAAALHVRETGARGLVGHAGPDGNNAADRIARFGHWSRSIGECISYGDADPTGVVAQLLIDDGVRDRGHRVILLDPQWRYVGVSCGAHAVYSGMCVLDFAVAFTER